MFFGKKKKENNNPVIQTLKRWRYTQENVNKIIRAVVVVVWEFDLQLPMQSVTITTDVAGSNLDQGEVHNIMW
jgi:hypothetical protein